MKMNHNVRNLVLGGLFAALACVMTLLVRIPSPTGFTNLGDCIVLFGAFVLGPVWGAAAAAVGSALADLLASYAIYAPATFVIKGVTALIAALLWRALSKKGHPLFARIAACVVAELFMAAGYLVYEFALGYGFAAVQSIPGNLMQGLVGTVLAVLLCQLLKKTPILKEGLVK